MRGCAEGLIRCLGNCFGAPSGSGEAFGTLNRASGALLPETFGGLLGEQPGEAEQVVGGATEDEQPVYFFQSAQLHLAQRAVLLQPAEALLDQPAAAQAECVALVPRGSAVEAGAASVVVLGYVWMTFNVRAAATKSCVS